MTTIGGLDARKWIGRLVWARSKHRKGGPGPGIPVKLVSLEKDGTRATIIPKGHRGTEVVATDTLAPWWSRNPDLISPKVRATRNGTSRKPKH